MTAYWCYCLSEHLKRYSSSHIYIFFISSEKWRYMDYVWHHSNTYKCLTWDLFERHGKQEQIKSKLSLSIYVKLQKKELNGSSIWLKIIVQFTWKFCHRHCCSNRDKTNYGKFTSTKQIRVFVIECHWYIFLFNVNAEHLVMR